MAREPKRTARSITTLAQLDVKHGRLDGREGILVWVLLLDVAGDGVDSVAVCVVGAAEDGGISGEGDAAGTAGTAETRRQIGTCRLGGGTGVVGRGLAVEERVCRDGKSSSGEMEEEEEAK